ncbi:hypothetical protein K439DRAFT_1638648 [Ramaria rubella]|nr:hypothetical protein K439DRAFT_1638648 [Ramaria rubella]
MESTSTSISPPLYGYTDDEGFPHQVDTGIIENTPGKRKRSSRACDQCRKTKSKCERFPGSVACKNCLSLNQECTFLGPSRKRGPPKGYITALEGRVHRLEALWGVIVSSEDSRAQTLIADIVEDGLAHDILSEVDIGAFGPSGRARILKSHQNDLFESTPNSNRSFTSSRARREQLVLGNEEDPSTPSYRWQDLLNNHITARGIARRRGQVGNQSSEVSAPYAFATEAYDSQTQGEIGLELPPVKDVLPSLDPFSLPIRRPNDAETIWRALYDRSVPSSGEESEYDSDDPADAIGQLSLNEKEQVEYLGKTSGMHLLAKPQRSDALNDGGIWRLPQSRYWPMSMKGCPMIEEDLRLNIPLPSQEVQDQLLELYWTYVQPVLPVLDKAKFLAEYNAERGRPCPSHLRSRDLTKPIKKVPRLLLLAMFTIAARYSNHEPLPPEGKMWEAGCEFLDHAKLILNWTYDSPRPSTSQALILLAYREFGIGAISQAWIYMGMAIRMATDLGMHRAADRWERPGRVLFTEAEKSSRKRLWHCCVILDRIMAFSMGRPMCIRERDYDTSLPSTEENEEMEGWTPKQYPASTLKPARTLSCLTATASLSSILALVVDTIYACRSGVSFVVRHVESFKIAARLDEWYRNIPEHLRYNLDVDETVPLPHTITLHMMYWCVVLLVHRPFIRHHKHELTHTNIPEEEISQMSEKSFAHSAYAASRVSSLVDIYRRTWDLSRANVFVCWYVMSAGVMHVATLTMRMGDQDRARLGLQCCLEAFHQMKLVWPSSERAWQLLRGAELDLSVTLPPVPAFPKHREQQHETAFAQRHTAPESTVVAHVPVASTQPSSPFPSLTTAMGRSVNGPAPDVSYFPGYDYWPPESLVFDPPFLNMDEEDVKYNPNHGLAEGDVFNMSRTDSFGMTAPTDSAFGATHAHGHVPNSIDDPKGTWQ